jgi:hypothetical protein
MKTATVLVLAVALPAMASSHRHRRQFAEARSERLHLCHIVMGEYTPIADKPNDKFPTTLSVIEEAYMNAARDLDEFEGGSRRVSEERLENDVSEVEDDLGGRWTVARLAARHAEEP